MKPVQYNSSIETLRTKGYEEIQDLGIFKAQVMKRIVVSQRAWELATSDSATTQAEESTDYNKSNVARLNREFLALSKQYMALSKAQDQVQKKIDRLEDARPTLQVVSNETVKPKQLDSESELTIQKLEAPKSFTGLLLQSPLTKPSAPIRIPATDPNRRKGDQKLDYDWVGIPADFPHYPTALPYQPRP